MNPRRLFVASCISLVTSAFTFVVRGDILQPMGDAFSLSQHDKGQMEGAVFVGMAVSMFIGGFICDLLGMKRIMFLAFFSHLFGVLGTIFAPQILHGIGAGPSGAFLWLYITAFLMGCGNGMVETGINPLAATLFPTRKTHFLNILHAWWPGGLIIGGLSVKLVRQGIDLGFLYIPGRNLAFEPAFTNWQVSLFLILIPCLMYGAMLVGQRFPLTERVESGVSTVEMFKEAIRPAFLLWAFCMLLTAATELGPQKWQESVMTRTAGVSGTMILVYTSGLMFIMRHFAGPLAHRISPVGMVTVSATLSAIGLYLLSTATSGLTAFAYATIFGVGIAYFWPTMLGVTAERFPKGGALLLCLMGSVGNLSISQVLPAMGKIYDHYAVEQIQTTNPGLAAAVVKGEALNQNLVKQIDLRTKLSPDEKKALEPTAWLTPAQRDAVAKGQKPDLSLQQRLIFAGLGVDETGATLAPGSTGADQVKRELETDMAVAERPNLSATQKEILDKFKEVRQAVGELALLREVERAELTEEQRKQLAAVLEQRGQAEVAKKVLENDIDPTKLTTQQNRAIENALKEVKLAPNQEEVVKQRQQLAEAEARGASMAFAWVTVLPTILIFIFGAIALTDRMRGGYKAVHIGEVVTKEREASPL
jgi:fucose permease